MFFGQMLLPAGQFLGHGHVLGHDTILCCRPQKLVHLIPDSVIRCEWRSPQPLCPLSSIADRIFAVVCEMMADVWDEMAVGAGMTDVVVESVFVIVIVIGNGNENGIVTGIFFASDTSSSIAAGLPSPRWVWIPVL